jgi:purine-cytosine permease-like protein
MAASSSSIASSARTASSLTRRRASRYSRFVAPVVATFFPFSWPFISAAMSCASASRRSARASSSLSLARRLASATHRTAWSTGLSSSIAALLRQRRVQLCTFTSGDSTRSFDGWG